MNSNNAYLTGFGVFLPNEPVSNEEMEEVLGLVNGKPSRAKDRILKQNGIKSRYYAIDKKTGKQTHTNAQLTALAVKDLLNNTNLSPDIIECLVCGTSTPDQFIPNHAVMVHGELKSPPCEVVSTSGVCCSSVAAFKYGYMNVRAGLKKNAVITGSELASPSFKAEHFQPEMEAKIQKLKSQPQLAFEKDFIRWMLSDAAAAALITDQPRQDGISLKIDWIEYLSFANELETCMYAGGEKRPDGSLQSWRDVEDLYTPLKEGYFALKQDVRVLIENITSYNSKSLLIAKDKHNLKTEEITWLLPHYSSEFFGKQMYNNLAAIGMDIPYDKWFTNLSYKGNTGSASIWVMLEELMSSGKVKRGDKILCFVPESARFSYAYFHLTAV